MYITKHNTSMTSSYQDEAGDTQGITRIAMKF